MFRHFTIIGRIFYLANSLAPKFGFSGSVNKVINKLGNKLTVRFDSRDAENCLRNKPVLLISNHPFMFGVTALIASIPPRSDSCMIINSDYFSSYQHLDEFLIPVYIRHQNYGNWYEKILAILFDKTFFYPSLTADEEHQENIRSIDNAGNKIKKGGLVIIFPEKRDPKLNWYKGVGYIIKNLGRDVQYKVIFAYLNAKSARFDYFRLFPPVGKILPPVSVDFSAPFSPNKVLSGGNNPGQISLKLQLQYRRWINNLV